MEVFKENETREVEKYKTSDGKIFNFKQQAEDHQKILDGLRKKCPTCNGEGILNERSEYGWIEDGWAPGSGSYGYKQISDTCNNCNGKGFLEKKTSWE